MSVASANFLSEALGYLRAMLADCPTWRALVELPEADWPTLAAAIAAAEGTQAAALAAIVAGYAEDEPGHPDFVPLPRAIIRHLDASDLERISTGGFGLNGMLMLTFEVATPAAYQRSHQSAYTHVGNVIGGIVGELAALPRQAGYLDLSSLGMGPIGQADPAENPGPEFFGSEWLVSFRGGQPS